MLRVENIETTKGEFEEKELYEEVKSTKALIQTFLQTLKAYRLYESNHPILSKFLERLKRDFENYFEEFDSFSLQVGEYNLYFKGKVVYESDDIKESLAFHFFKDGIREIRFLKGLEFEEIVDFLNIVRKSDFINRLEDDLVTLLWERDFSHIIFTTVDEFLDGKDGSVPATIEDLNTKLEFKISLETEHEDGGTELKDDKSDSLAIDTLNQSLNLSVRSPLIQVCQLTTEEMEAIYEEVRREEQPDFLHLIENLIEILLHLGEDVDAYENMISYFDRLIESLLQQKRLDIALEVLKTLSNTMESIVLRDKQIFAIKRILDNPSKPHLIELLAKLLNENVINAETVIQYFGFVTQKATETLCLILKEIKSGKWRKFICDKIALLCKDDITPITKFLSDSDPFSVCHIIYIIGKIGNPISLKYLSSLTKHIDRKVREEVMYAIYRFGEKGSELIKRFLNDSDKDIRMKASILFAKMAKEEAFEPLKEIILSKDFYKADYQEKSTFFKALAETGSKEASPFLRKIANKRRFFQRAKWKEMRICARNTLKLLGEEMGN